MFQLSTRRSVISLRSALATAALILSCVVPLSAQLCNENQLDNHIGAYVFAIPGGWTDLCAFGASGNWKISVVYCSVAPPVGAQFLRGDANSDLLFNIADPIRSLDALFGTPPNPLDCPDAGDANDDGALNIADAIYMLGAIFSGGDQPPAPGVVTCGPDPTADALDCASPPTCP